MHCPLHGTIMKQMYTQAWRGCPSTRGSQRLHQLLKMVSCSEHIRLRLLGQELLDFAWEEGIALHQLRECSDKLGSVFLHF